MDVHVKHINFDEIFDEIFLTVRQSAYQAKGAIKSNDISE